MPCPYPSEGDKTSKTRSGLECGDNDLWEAAPLFFRATSRPGAAPGASAPIPRRRAALVGGKAKAASRRQAPCRRTPNENRRSCLRRTGDAGLAFPTLLRRHKDADEPARSGRLAAGQPVGSTE